MATRDDGMITVYVCWHERNKGLRHRMPGDQVLLYECPYGKGERFVGIDNHPYRTEIESFGLLVGMWDKTDHLSNDFEIPIEWWNLAVEGGVHECGE